MKRNVDKIVILAVILAMAFGVTTQAADGCCEVMGDYNDDGRFDILDIDEWCKYNFMIWPYYPPSCPEELEVDGDGVFTILDMDYFIGYLLRGDYPSLPECPGPTVGCCEHMGDFDHDGDVDEDDLWSFARWLNNMPPCGDPACCDEVDLDHDGTINILDLHNLEDYVLRGLGELGPCGEYSGSDDWCHKCLIK